MIIQIEFNIGLNVGNKEPADQLQNTIAVTRPLYYYIKLGEWEGVTERVVVGVSNIEMDNLESTLKSWCKELNQNAIPYRGFGRKGIIFNDNYKGTHYEFDDNLFVSITRTGETKVGV